MYNTPGYKNDNGKVRMDLLPPDSLKEIAKVFTNGAEKYEVGNWEKGMNWSRIYAATQRHLNAFWSGEDIDSEWNLHHLAHAGCNILMLLSLYMREKGIDDRIYKSDYIEDEPTDIEKIITDKEEFVHYTEFFMEVNKKNNLVIIYKSNHNNFKYEIYYDIPMNISNVDVIIGNVKYKVKECFSSEELTFGEISDIISNILLTENKNIVIKTISDDDDTYTIKPYNNKNNSKDGYYYDVISNKTGERIINPLIRHDNPLSLDQIIEESKLYREHKEKLKNGDSVKTLIKKLCNNEVNKDDSSSFSVNLKDGFHNNRIDRVGLPSKFNNTINKESKNTDNNKVKILTGNPKSNIKPVIKSSDNIRIIDISTKNNNYKFEVTITKNDVFYIYKFKSEDLPNFKMSISTNRKISDEKLKELIISELRS